MLFKKRKYSTCAYEPPPSTSNHERITQPALMILPWWCGAHGWQNSLHPCWCGALEQRATRAFKSTFTCFHLTYMSDNVMKWDF